MSRCWGDKKGWAHNRASRGSGELGERGLPAITPLLAATPAPLHYYLLLPLHHYTLLPLLPLLLPGLLPCMGHPIKTTFTTILQSSLSSLLPLGSTLSKGLLNLSLVESTRVKQQAVYGNKKDNPGGQTTTTKT